jgi:hypothetical protein
MNGFILKELSMENTVMATEFNFLNNLPILKPPLNILGELGRGTDENNISKLLCGFLNSSNGWRLHQKIACSFEELKKFKGRIQGKQHSHTEYSTDDRRRIDIFSNYCEQKYLIAIENKVFADEHGGQIESYQDFLEKQYPDYDGFFIFLTPSGRPPRTANSNSRFHCYSLSYATLSDFLSELIADNIEPTYLRSLVDCFKDNIIMSPNREILKIWGSEKNRNALLQLFKYKPTIRDIHKQLKDEINKFLGKDDSILCSELNGSNQYGDNQFRLKTRKSSAILQIQFIFHYMVPGIPSYPDAQPNPSLSVVISEKEEDFQKIWNEIENMQKTGKSISFEKIDGWGGWRSVFCGGYKASDFSVSGDHDYGEELVKKLLEDPKGFKDQYLKVLAILPS